MEMFCNQCEQAALGTGCVRSGVCGKDPVTSALQDIIIHGLKGLAVYRKNAVDAGFQTGQADQQVIEALFSTVTNVDFDPERLVTIIKKTREIKERLAEMIELPPENKNLNIAAWRAADTVAALCDQAAALKEQSSNPHEDIVSLRQMLLYGIKGVAAYADHAWILGYKNREVLDFFYKALISLDEDSLTMNNYLELVLECGRINLACMELLDTAHTETFGHPEPTVVNTGVKRGPAILVSGHDLPDLSELLKQTDGTGVNVYTHGEMLPAHGYPQLKRYRHLAGNFGGAWQDQQKDFDTFPGPILMTTNCIQKPRDSYADRIFTTGLVAYPGVRHLSERKDFSVLIDKAKELGGFPDSVPGKELTVGFAHNAVLGLADTVVNAVREGAVKHFYLIGGCDGAKPGRNYYTELAEKVPEDSVILTLACGKYRFNKFEYGNIGGIPRLLDIGQCNDAYSAIKIAVALSEAFGVGVNDLPLSIILSWYEQKAVCILLTLLYLGIKNIKLGPTLPAFVSPNVLKLLVEKYNIGPITNAEDDLKQSAAV